MEVKNQWKGWLYLAPALILLAIFTFYPFFKTIVISFLGTYDASGVLRGYNPANIQNGYEFTLNNFYAAEYKEVFKDGVYVNQMVITGAFGSDKFIKALGNTAFIAFVTVPLSTVIALLISVALNSIKPLRNFLQTVYFLPYVTNSIAIGMVFAIMFDVSSPNGTLEKATSLGIINEFLKFFGFKPIIWIGTGATWLSRMTVACVYGIWSALPFKIMILLGALQSVNKQYYEAAQIDCASKGRVFRKITVPMLSPMISYLLITGFIGAFKEYSSLIGIFGDTMLDKYGINTIVGLVYSSLSINNYGLASAYAIALFCVILVFTMINLYVSNRHVHY